MLIHCTSWHNFVPLGKPNKCPQNFQIGLPTISFLRKSRLGVIFTAPPIYGTKIKGLALVLRKGGLPRPHNIYLDDYRLTAQLISVMCGH